MKTRRFTTKVVVSLILLLLSALLAVGVRTVFGACGAKEDGSYMSCHGAEQALFAAGLALAGISLAALCAATRGAYKVFRIACALMLAAAVCAALLPGRIIPLCMMPGMRCRSVMQPCATVIAALIALTAAAGAVLPAGKHTR